MAYCLRSFVQILEEVLHPEQHHKKWVLDQDKRPQVQAMWETASFLKDFLDNSSPLIQYRISNLEDQIMDAAKKAEDTLETYLTSQLISIPEGQTFTISPLNMSETIQAFEDARQEVKKIMDEIVVQRADGNVLLPVSTTRYPNHNNVVVGVTEDLKQLRSRLTSRASELDIIPIVGMGGMGKTTLARILYDEYASSNTHFDCCAWVTISQTYHPQQILKTLLDCLPEKNHDNNLVVRLHKNLYGRRYLIVLDDIWSPKAWDDMQRSFPRDSKGSRIILTTREKTVVDYVNPKCHQLHLINEDDSWKLLSGKVFGEKSCPRVLEEVGKSIAKSCGGLPLALQVIGGLLLQSHKSIDLWKHVADDVRSLIAETDDQFSGIFDWSFNHLPFYLKPCFLYMAGFREDEEIQVSKIIKLWVAEGFLFPIRDKSIEEAARIHLNALVDRNLIFVRGRGKSGRAKTFGIHDILRDLCLRKAQEKKFLYFGDIQIDNLQVDDLCLGRIVSVAKSPKLTPLTRSFRSYSDWEDSSCLCSKLSLLRVLDFGFQSRFDEFPEVILQLVNLRYLHIISTECTPKSISVLRNLQKLIVLGIPSLALIISNMPQLRYLKFNWIEEHFCTPKSISMLRNLQKLIVVGIPSVALIMISNMPRLRHLKFNWIEEEDSESAAYGDHENLQSLSRLKAKEVKKLFGKLSNLRKLSMIFGYDDDEEFMDLTCFHNLKTFYCEDDYRYSRIITFPVSLKKLTLHYCKIDQSILDAIANLPNLHILRIKYSPEKMDWEACEGGFCELRYLELYGWDLENWLASEVHFPVLEHLVLKNCFHLIDIPIDFGCIETLRIIEVDGCSPSAFNAARRIYEGQCQFGNTALQLRLKNEDEQTL